jgi:hypothetical protein
MDCHSGGAQLTPSGHLLLHLSVLDGALETRMPAAGREHGHAPPGPGQRHIKQAALLARREVVAIGNGKCEHGVVAPGIGQAFDPD